MRHPYRWIGLESSAVTAIRRTDTTHTILASGAHYDSLDDLLVTRPNNPARDPAIAKALNLTLAITEN